MTVAAHVFFRRVRDPSPDLNLCLVLQVSEDMDYVTTALVVLFGDLTLRIVITR